MSPFRTGVVATLALMGAAGEAARAQSVDDPWFVHIGPARLSTDEQARVRVGGGPLPGADVELRAHYTAAVEIGRFVAPSIAVALSVGVPFEQAVTGDGAIRPFGRLGRLTYGPAAATVQWHPLRSASVRPYVGAGVAYVHVFDTDDGALQSFRVDDKVGPVIQGGVEVTLKRNFGLFVDAKKGFLRTDASGSLGGAPVDARLRLDPLVLHTGLAVRF